MRLSIFFNYLLIAVFGFFVVRSVDLMLIRGAYFQRLADENRIQRIRITPARGRILDRHGFELARNSVVYFDQQGNRLDRQQALELEAKSVSLEKQWIREYPLAEAGAHLTGYLGQATEEEIKQTSEDCPIGLGDLVGRGGIEQFYDCFLRGKPGEKLVEVNARGEIVREIGKKDPIVGEDIQLTIDKNWQRSAWEALKGNKGAAVVLDPNNGQILALVSWPSFDPNAFTKFRDEAKISQWLNDPDFPFLNRAISGAYHPGSTFKMITAIAGLEEGKIDAQTQVEDTGVIKIGQWQFGNWYWLEYGRKEGMVDLVKAIKRSNDIYFYKVGQWVGIEALLSWAKKFGLGQPTGIDLPGEIGGFLPSPEWKERVKGEQWFLGNTYHLAIGQGDLTMTPLQVALETAVIANGGKWCQPHLVESSKSEILNSKQYRNSKFQIQNNSLTRQPANPLTRQHLCHDLGIKPEYIKLIKKGMIEACSPGGTGFPFFNFEPRVACKTGTAEVGDGTDDSHAWFTLFYPADYPEVVITILVERGGSGAYIAAPIAKKIIEAQHHLTD